MMTPEHKKEWFDACNKVQKEKGYVPAELQMIPIIVALAEEGLIEIAMDTDKETTCTSSFDNFTFITTNTKGDK